MIDQLSLDDAPRVRRKDPETSRAAAAALTPGRLSSHRWAALVALAQGPATDFELAQRTGIQQTSVGKRRLELARLGYVEDTGLRRPSPSGSPAIVWGLTREGYDFYAGEPG